MSTSNQNSTPNWLKSLQDTSWEIELLISGGAIFSLFQFSEVYTDWILNLRILAHFAGAGVLLMLGMIGIKVLTLGFILHLLLRAFWLAMVCINYVYPEGIQKDRIKWKKPFHPKIDNLLDLKDQIIRLDKICGTVMYMTIIAAFAIIGLSICLVLIIFTCFGLLDPPYSDSIGSIGLITVFIYTFDLLGFGFLRKAPFLSYVVYLPFSLIDKLTLRNSYQKSLWLFSTNVKKGQFSFYALLFFSVSIYLAYQALYPIQHWPNMVDQREYRFQMADGASMSDMNYMENWSENNRNPVVGIGSKLVKGNYLEVFVRYDNVADLLLDQSKKAKEDRRLSDILEVQIDDQLIDNLIWSSARKLNKRIGISTFLPLNQFENGRHLVKINVHPDFHEEALKALGRTNISIIPFWIDRSTIELQSP